MSHVRIVRSGATPILQAARPSVSIGTPMTVTHNDIPGRSTAAAHPAAAVTFAPAGSISAVTVQAAIAELDAEKQPLDADLTAIAALTTTAYGRGMLTVADAPALAVQAGIPLLATTGISGALTLTKPGTTARTATFPDAVITVAGSAAALTSGRVPFATTAGLLTDSASLSFADPNLTLSAAANGTVQHLVRNTDAAGTSAQAQIQVSNGASATSDLSIGAYGASRSGSQLGATRANAAFLFSTSASITALVIGHTGSSAPVIIGSNNAAICTFATTGITCSSTTDATAIGTAAVVVSGGIGVAKAIVLTASTVGATYWGPTGTNGSTRCYGNGSGVMIFEKRSGGSWVEIGRFA